MSQSKACPDWTTSKKLLFVISAGEIPVAAGAGVSAGAEGAASCAGGVTSCCGAGGAPRPMHPHTSSTESRTKPKPSNLFIQSHPFTATFAHSKLIRRVLFVRRKAKRLRSAKTAPGYMQTLKSLKMHT